MIYVLTMVAMMVDIINNRYILEKSIEMSIACPHYGPFYGFSELHVACSPPCDLAS